MNKDFIFGVCYYPEHWDKKEWITHIDLMKELGVNTIRTGDFAWGIFESKEGKYDFSLLDEAMELWRDAKINVILCTPTAAPPKWVINKYDILQENRYGIEKGYGSRREACANKPDYVKISLKIVEEMAKHYADHPQVIGWQIDNEFGCHNSTYCYCESCRLAFSKWLKRKYENIDELNKKWGNVFWSLQYSDFTDVILPKYNSCEPECQQSWSHNPSLDLEYRRFASDTWIDYLNMQKKVIRKYSNKPITHNFMGHFSDINYFKMANELDFVEWDNYPDNQWGNSEYEYVSMAHEIMRGVKNKNFIVAEQQAGPAGWDKMGATPEPGQLRLWSHQAVAHGADGIIYFRFKTPSFGMEQYWYGILDHDGIPRRRFREIKQINREFQILKEHVLEDENLYDCLIVRTYDNIWAHFIKSQAYNFDYRQLLYQYYKINSDLNILTAVGIDSFEKYKMVYMPAYNIIDLDLIEKIKSYVEDGGVLVTTFLSGAKDEYNNMRTDVLPGAFREIAGVEIEEFDALRKETNIIGLVESKVKIWADILAPTTAKVLCVYGNRYFKGKPAITVNQYGKGKVYYIGCDLELGAMKRMIEYIATEEKVPYFKLPDGVEYVRRKNYDILLNHNDFEIDTGIKGKSILHNNRFMGHLEGYGVEYLVIDKE